MKQIYMGGNNENDRVAFPESVPFTLRYSFTEILSTDFPDGNHDAPTKGVIVAIYILLREKK